MIITRNGEILQCFHKNDGIVIKDGEFSICLEYSKEQREQYARMEELKQNLSKSDYKALKFSDGMLSEEEYAPIRCARQAWRDEINEIERTFSEPTITREEMDIAEAAALRNFEKENN